MKVFKMAPPVAFELTGGTDDLTFKRETPTDRLREMNIASQAKSLSSRKKLSAAVG